MKFISAFVSLAIAVAGVVNAAGYGSSTGSLAAASGTPNPVASGLPIAVPLVQTSQHSVFAYLSMTGNAAAAYTYAYHFNGTADTANVAVTAANGNVAQYVRSPIYCTVCNSNVTTAAGGYNFDIFSLNATYGTASNTIAYNFTAITDTNVQLTSTPIGLNAPTVDNLQMQPGKLLTFTVPAFGAGTGNVTSATIAFSTSTSVAPFTSINVVGGGICPIPASDGVNRYTHAITGASLGSPSFTVQNVTAGTWWVYLAPAALPTVNTLQSTDTIAVTVATGNGTQCIANVGGLCNVQTSGSSNGTIALTSSGTVSPVTPIAVPILQPATHSVFGYISLTGSAANAYSYSYYFNGTADTAGVNVAAANGNQAQIVVSALTCNVCNPILNNTLGYEYVFNSLNATYGTAANTIAYSAVAITDTNVALTNATALSLKVPTIDAAQAQPGKLLYFSVPAPTGNLGNSTYALVSLSTATNPFNTISVVGNGKCPIVPATADGITRQTFSVASNVSLSGTVNITNLTTGTFWIYMSPSTTTKNTLGNSDTITVTLAPFATASCAAGSNGFCTSAALTLKTVSAVIVGGFMTAAYMLL